LRAQQERAVARVEKSVNQERCDDQQRAHGRRRGGGTGACGRSRGHKREKRAEKVGPVDRAAVARGGDRRAAQHRQRLAAQHRMPVIVARAQQFDERADLDHASRGLIDDAHHLTWVRRPGH
jgi:hypothetical protein